MVYVRFDVPDEVQDTALALLEKFRETGRIKKGTNETTKVVERGQAKLVYIATDVEPPEIVAHLPLLCEEKNVPYIYIKSKSSLGQAAGLQVNCAAVAVVDEGEAKKELRDLVTKIDGLKK
ncbi:LSU ribosomal protein L7AE [Archaeoglobus sulfaticallidus PM70-1]|uniref:Large ribosomal subunit protein eL8 n=1 Tax=Archaeoglobus sulfaticallidus PM70-1 TaxID=387631 RepID=N0BEY0_9EURY|nr:50S ribosomal protein L7Ae [Archaeoglobus sulfaticallidus]AGK62209.1 LSU ribosomal protein L7AE [Archaeoglobus sulfaticallidus PM70-1]